jgi:predicted Rossmann fold nucleotide-binding protein DprA/Smf involved in DNA uptake
MADRPARDLANRGLVIVSGLARGVDSSTQKGALSFSGGREDWRPRVRD